MFRYKKALGSVVVIGFFVTFIVLFVIFFQTWYQTFNSGLVAEIDRESYDSITISGIDKVVKGKLYFKNNKNKEVIIKKVTVSGKDCDINQNASVGVNLIDINGCALNLDGAAAEVIIQTNEDLFSKVLILDIVPPYNNKGIPIFVVSDNESDTNDAKAFTLEIDDNDNMYVGGVYSGVLDLGNGLNLSDLGNENYFLVKYDKNMNPLWIVGPNSGISQIRGSAIDNEGNIYLTGSYRSFILDINGSVVLTNSNGDGSQEIFIIKYNNSGDLVDAVSYGDVNDDYGSDIYVDDTKNIYLTGRFRSNILDFGDGVNTTDEDYFLVKFNSNFDPLWVANASITGKIEGEYSTSLVEKNSSIYVGGYFRSKDIYFGNGVFLINYLPGDMTDFFLVKYNSSGVAQWARSANGKSGSEQLTDVKVNDLEEIYVFGSYIGDYLNFTPTFTFGASNSNDVFVAKYNSQGEVLDIVKATGDSAESPENIFLKDNSIYATGYFLSSFMDFGDDVNISNPGDDSLYLAKYDSDLNPIWARTSNNTDEDIAKDLVVSSNGRVFIDGYFKSSINFGNGIVLQNNQNYDYFLTKYE